MHVLVTMALLYSSVAFKGSPFNKTSVEVMHFSKKPVLNSSCSGKIIGKETTKQELVQMYQALIFHNFQNFGKSIAAYFFLSFLSIDLRIIFPFNYGIGQRKKL